MSHSRSAFAVYILILLGSMVGCLALTGWLGLTAWSDVWLVIKLSGAIALAGVAEGMLAKGFVGRHKSLVSNALGIVLVILVWFGAGTAMIHVYFDNTTAMSAVGRSIGFALSLSCAGGATEVGRRLVRQVLARRQQASKWGGGEQ